MRMHIFITLLFSIFIIGNSYSQNFTVNSIVDSPDAVPGDGICDDGTGVCSLRAAVMESNALGGNHIINVPSGTYTLSIIGANENAALTGDLDVNSNITLIGASPLTTIINADSLDRIFHIQSGALLNASQLTLTEGYVSLSFGGGILNEGSLELNYCEIVGNIANAIDEVPGVSGGFGGGLANLGNALISNCTFYSNNAIGSEGSRAITGGGGGGSSPGFGGGIYNHNTGDLQITNSTISGNKAIGGMASRGSTNGGSWGSPGSPGAGPFFGAGGATNGAGGNATGDYSGGGGGGSNASPGGIGGNGEYGAGAGAGGASAGGGAAAVSGVPGFGGGIANQSCCSAVGGGGAGAGFGGGIFNNGGTTSLLNVTVAFNFALGGFGSTGSGGYAARGLQGTGFGGGIFNRSGTMDISNTLIANNTSNIANNLNDPIAVTYEDLYGTFGSSDGSNLILNPGAGSVIGGNTAGNLTGIDPLLFPLALNGGVTLTHAIPNCPPGPASEAANDAVAPLLDQRDYPRIGIADIGAYEAESALIDFNYSMIQPCGVAADGSITVTPTGASTYTYQWDAAAANQIDPIGDNLSAGFYTISISDANGCVKDTTFELISLPLPDSGTDGAITYCAADAASDLFTELTGTPEATGTWSPVMTSGTGVFDPAVDAAGTYTYSVTNSCGTVSSTVDVTVNPMPDSGIDGAITYCAADAASDLFTELSGTPDVAGTWSPAMASGTGVFDPTVDAAGTYTYTVTNSCATISSTVDVTVNPMPDSGINGVITYCAADAASDLFTELTGTPDVTGTWSPAMTSGTGVFDPAVDAAGTYTYSVTNSCGTVSSTVDVTVNPMPDSGIDGAITYCAADAVSDLFTELTGTPDATGTWSPVMTSGTGVFDPTLDAAGTYTYTVTNSCVTISSTVDVTVNPMPDSGIDGAITYCAADAASDLFTELTGTPDATGTWSPAMTSGTGVFDPAVDAAGTYTYTVTNSCGTISSNVDVTVNPMPDSGIDGAITYCAADAASDLFTELTGTPDVTGTWSPAMTSGTGVFDPAVDAAGTYTYTVTNSCGTISSIVDVTVNPMSDSGIDGAITYCATGAASDLFTELTGTPDATGTWSPAMTSGTGVFDPAVDAAGTYTYTVTNSCSTISSTVDVSFIVDPNPGMDGVISFCDTDAPLDLFPILGGTPNTGGVWSPALSSGSGVYNPAVDAGGVYTYSITTSCGTFSSIVDVTLNVSDDATFSYPTDNYCIDGTNPIASVNVPNGGVFTVSAGGIINAVTGAIDLTGSGIGTFDVTYSTTGSCPDTFVLTINILDVADASINPYGPYCSADNPVILVGADQGGTWSGPGVDPITGEFNPALANIGNNTIVYTISGACGDSQSIQIEVIESPVVTAGSDETIIFGNTVNLTSAGTFGTYQWSPITGVDCPICQNSTASPESTTVYIITQENNGCFASADMIITVEYEPYIFIPNIFSPNNDNQNDALFVRGTGISTIEFLVFDRWGEKVFETNSLEIGWDGTFRGQDMSPGVFMYVASVTFTDGSNSIVKGDVTLIR